VKQIKCGTRLDRCYWRAIKVFPPFCLLYMNYDRCFKLSIPSIYHKLFKYKNVNQFFPSKISCDSFFPEVIFLSKWIFIKGWMLGCLSCVIWPHLPNQDASERKEGRLEVLRGKVPFTQDLGYHLINFFNVHQQPIFIIIFRNFKRLLAQWMKS
jgi:hypothetical protein